MSWKKRRRYPLRMISMICASCTVIFLFANVLLLNSDISRMLESTARDLRQSLQSSFHRDPGSTDIQHTEESDKWQPLLRENIIETRLRKLMENTQNGVQISGIKDRTTRPVSSADILYMLSQNSDCEGINNASMKMKKFIASAGPRRCIKWTTEGSMWPSRRWTLTATTWACVYSSRGVIGLTVTPNHHRNSSRRLCYFADYFTTILSR